MPTTDPQIFEVQEPRTFDLFDGDGQDWREIIAATVFGAIISTLILVIGDFVLGLGETDGIALISIILFFVATAGLSVAVGNLLAQILLPVVAHAFAGALRRAHRAYADHARQSAWPGRRFLDLLRYARLSQVRREFLSMGLESSLPPPQSTDLNATGQLSSMLHTLQHEANLQRQAELERAAEHVRRLLHRILHLERVYRTLQHVIVMGVPIVIFYLINVWLAGSNILGAWDISNFGNYFQEQSIAFIILTNSIAFLALSPLAVYLVGQCLFVLGWSLVQRTRTQLDDIALTVLAWSIAGITGITLIYYPLSWFERWPEIIQTGLRTLKVLLLPASGQVTGDGGAQGGNTLVSELDGLSLLILSVLMIGWLSAMLILLLRRLCQRILRQMAARTEQKYDDMAVELVNIFGTFIIAAMGAGWIFVVATSGAGGGGIEEFGGSLLPMAILVGVAGTILGVGSRDLLTNFFAGISLRIDKPFEARERVVLESGAICEVRSIGMRSTQFFNISENTDLFVPNTELAQQTVTNLSRPDREYRRVLRYWTAPSQGLDAHTPQNANGPEAQHGDGIGPGVSDNNTLNPHSLYEADSLLLLAAYSVEGIDVPTIRDEHSERSMFHKDRPGVAAEFAKLQDRYVECANAMIKVHGKTVPVSRMVEETCRRLSDNIRELHEDREARWDYRRGLMANSLDLAANAEQRERIWELAKTAHDTSYGFHELRTCLYTLSATYPAMRADLEHLTLELLRAPSVRSKQIITEQGEIIWEVDLMLYTRLTEESEEIIHQLNIFAQYLLEMFGLVARSAARVNSAEQPDND